MAETKHTPLPWTQYCAGNTIYGGDGFYLGIMQGKNPEDDAALVVAAVNSYASQASRIEELEKAILGLVPGHRDPDGMCWCSYGHNLNFSDHQPSCITARSALSGEQANG